MIRIALAGLFLVSLSAEAAGTRRFAVVAGANDGGADRVTLRYAVSDAHSMGQVLVELGGVALPDRRMLVEPNPVEIDLALAEVRAAVAEAHQAGQRAELLVYYSGHSNESGLLLGQDSYEYEALRQAVDAVGADVRVVILDSCSSGSLVRTKGGTRRPSFLLDDAVDVKGVAYLTSSAENEAAQESDMVGASFFTHYLVSGLRGAADATQDRRVTLNEAYQFAYNETLRRTERTLAGPQHAAYDIRLAGTGDLVMTDLTEPSASLRVPEGMGGRLAVRDAGGGLVAELLKPKERAVELALAPGTYEVLIEDVDGRRREAEIVLAEGDRRDLLALDWAEVGVEVAVSRGDQGVLRALPLPELLQRGPVLQATLVPGVETPAAKPTTQALGVSLLWGRTQAVQGAQLGLGGAVTEGAVHGVQLAQVFAEADAVSGMQAAYVAKAGQVDGLQAGLVTVAEEVRGAQLGLISVSKDHEGVQAGLVSVTERGHGLQLGLINVSKDHDGVPLGLITVNPTGYNHVWVRGSLDDLGIDVSYGGKRVYTLAGVTVEGLPDAQGEAVSSLFGLGLHTGDRVFLDVDLATGPRIVDGLRRTYDDGLTNRLRLIAGVKVFRSFSPFVGLSMQATVPFEFDDDLQTQIPLPYGTTVGIGGLPIPVWGSWMVGVRF